MTTDVTAAASVPVSSTCTTACQPITNSSSSSTGGRYSVPVGGGADRTITGETCYWGNLPNRTASSGCTATAVHARRVRTDCITLVTNRGSSDTLLKSAALSLKAAVMPMDWRVWWRRDQNNISTNNNSSSRVMTACERVWVQGPC